MLGKREKVQLTSVDVIAVRWKASRVELLGALEREGLLLALQFKWTTSLLLANPVSSRSERLT